MGQAHDGLVIRCISGTDEWTASSEELDELLDAFGQSDALDNGAVPTALLTTPGATATPEQIELSLLRLATQPPDSDYTPERWIEWLRFLARAARSGGASS